ncbi:MAG: DNRLRE domain-containing protein, partial [Litorilinea sp.]
MQPFKAAHRPAFGTRSAQLSVLPARLTVRRLLASLLGVCVLWFATIPIAYSQETVYTAQSQQLAVLNPVQDTYVSNMAATTSFGQAAELRLQQQQLKTVVEERVMLQFDLGQLPKGAIIQQAELRLFQNEIAGSIPIALDRIAARWDESRVTWNTQPDTAAYYAQALTSMTAASYVTWDITELATEWRDAPATTANHGVLLRFGQGQELSAFRRYDSSTGPNPPELRILYTPAPLEIPGDSPAVDLEPNCLLNNSRYKDGANYTFRGADNTLSGTVMMIHDGEILYMCVGGFGDANRFFGIYIDPAHATTRPPQIPGKAQIGLRVDIATGEFQAVRGTGEEGRPWVRDASIDNWRAVAAPPPPSIGTISAEYAIPLETLGVRGVCGQQIGLAAYHQSNEKPGDDYGWPRRVGPNNPASWATIALQDVTCPIHVICTTTNAPCAPSDDVAVFDATTGASYDVGADGYLLDRDSILNGATLWARHHFTDVEHLQATVYHTSGAPQVVGDAEFSAPPLGEMVLYVSPATPLMTFDIDMSTQWRVEDDPVYSAWLLENLQAASQYLYRYSNSQVALGKITINQDGAGWQAADIRLHAHNHMRPNAILGGVNPVPLPDPDNDQLPAEITGEIVYYPGNVRIGAAWNRYNLPAPSAGFPVDVGEDWAMVLAHEMGHYLLYLRDTYFRIGPDDTIVNVYSCVGSAMGWVYFPENHGFVYDPTD